MMATPANHTYIALIDLGNTRVKAGWVNRLSGEREDETLAVEYSDASHVASWFIDQNLRPHAVFGVSVAGSHKTQIMETQFLHTFGIAVQWLHSERQTARVFNRYRDPRQLGTDRWIAMIGLSQVSSENTVPLLLANFGTATTLDTLCPTRLATRKQDTRDGLSSAMRDDSIDWVYDGGLILPGPALMRTSLANNTAQLPEANGPVAAFPTDTHQAITSGIAAAQAGALVRQWQAVLVRYGIAPRVYCTGGGWPAIQDEAQGLLAMTQCQNRQAVIPIQYLTSPILDGLARIAQVR